MAACVAVISAVSTSAAAGCKVRVIDIDPGTVALPRTWKKERGTLALVLARDDALVFGDMEGHHLHPERFSRTFREHLVRCRKALGDAGPPMIRLHDCLSR